MIKSLARFATVLAVVSMFAGVARAADGYTEVNPPQPTDTGNKIEVIEFFWYGCPHCYRFHPLLEEWKASLPDDVVFKPVPGVLNPSWVNHARAYYAAEVMGVVDKLHDPLFQALHKQRKRIFKMDDLADFAAEQGIDRDKFLATMTSFAVETSIRRSQQLARAYRINGVPTIAINGKYLTSGSLAGSYPRAIQIMNELIEKERSGG